MSTFGTWKIKPPRGKIRYEMSSQYDVTQIEVSNAWKSVRKAKTSRIMGVQLTLLFFLYCTLINFDVEEMLYMSNTSHAESMYVK